MSSNNGNSSNSRNLIFLFVALSVICIIVVVALLLFAPKEPAKTAAAPSATPSVSPVPGAPVPDEFDPVEWTRNPQSATGQVPASKPAGGDQGFTVTIPAESKAPVPVPTSAPVGPGVAFPGDSALAAPAPKAAGAPAKAPVPTAKPLVKAVVKPSPKNVKPAPTGYWIQVASFKDRYQAENAAKALETQGLKGTLSTATVNGQQVVRVRVGPYANEAEASKFLAWLKPVKEFENSYITKVVPPKAP